MLFHNLYDNESGAYIEQLSADLTDLNTTFFIKSWENVIKKHSSLRSIYYADALEIPVQCVSKTFEIPVQIFDFRKDSLEIQNQKIRQLEEKDLLDTFRSSASTSNAICLNKVKRQNNQDALDLASFII
jgi:hypothetical protein